MLLGSAIGAGMKVAGSIFGGISASKAAAAAKKSVEKELQDNQNWYDRRYNEDSTQRADAQRVWTQTKDLLRRQGQSAAATNAVMGGTDASLAMQKAAANQTLADTASQINAAGEQRKENIESTYMSNKANLNQKLRDIETQKAQAISQAVQGVSSAAGGVATAFNPAKS